MAHFRLEALYFHLCVCGPVVGLGLYDDAPDTCSAADVCGVYVNDRERERIVLLMLYCGGWFTQGLAQLFGIVKSQVVWLVKAIV